MPISAIHAWPVYWKRPWLAVPGMPYCALHACGSIIAVDDIEPAGAANPGVDDRATRIAQQQPGIGVAHARALVPDQRITPLPPAPNPAMAPPMEALFTSTAIVALAEIGDKTQLLAMVLATRYRQPWPIVAGILVATLANHFLAALLGAQVAGLLEGQWFRHAVGASFLAMAAWTLVPDKLDEGEGAPKGRGGVFWTTTVAFFLVEIGDKTQIATIALGAQYQAVAWVTAGTTLGMLLANAPVVWLGDRLVSRLPMAAVRATAAALFAALGLWVILKAA